MPIPLSVHHPSQSLYLISTGILNYKYQGESVLRASGLPYTIVRPTGLIGEDKDEGPALLEASQGV